MPKSASRSLKKLGLLGETGEAHHAPIRSYPLRERYHWHVVVRDQESWFRSWWRQCRRDKDLFAIACGMRFADMQADLARLNDSGAVRFIPATIGVNAWVPADVTQVLPAYIERGRTFYDYCFDVITAGIECTRVSLADLDAWLTDRGYMPLRENCDAQDGN